ncbi:hypothetical protein GJ496_009262 [Pomphorhynchus laevis]|nr:hypothetical protein GJ496_009262 [Pomphorhynchus laevis]
MKIFLVLLLCYTQGQFIAISPPTIVDQPDKEEIIANLYSQKLRCNAIAEPPPRYEWFKNGGLFNFDVYNGRIVIDQLGNLIISRPEPIDAGVYQCFAFNRYGRAATDTCTVRWAEIGNFTDNQNVIRHKVKLGNPYTLECQGPFSVPEHVKYWVVADCESCAHDDEHIKDTGRISQDYLGNLHFASIEMSDSIKTKKFQCIAYNPVLNVVRKGPKHLFIINADKQKYHAPKPRWITELNNTGIYRQSLKMKCIFNGRPWPKTVWKRRDFDQNAYSSIDDGDNRFSITNFGQELQIKDLQFNDAGIYECRGINEYGQATALIRLSVNSPPLLSKNIITDVYTASDESANLTCSTQFNPLAQSIRWYKDTKLLIVTNASSYTNQHYYEITSHETVAAPNNPSINTTSFHGRLTFNGNTMTITRASITDTAVYQCNVSNSIGYSFVNIRLIVMDQKPILIPSKSSKYLKVVEGSNLTIKCTFFALPRPSMSWYRNSDNQISSKEIKLEQTVNFTRSLLYFTNVRPHVHSGNYTCVADNKYGTAKFSISVLIIKPTTFRIVPSSRQIKRGSELQLSCAVHIDVGNSAVIKWFKNGVELTIKDKHARVTIRYLSNQSVVLRLKPIHFFDNGLYTCLAKTEIDTINHTARIVVGDRPEPPDLLDVECVYRQAKYGNDNKLKNEDHNTKRKDKIDRAYIKWRSTARSSSLQEIIMDTLHIMKSNIISDLELIPRTIASDYLALVPSDKKFFTTKIPSDQTDIWLNLSCWANYTFRIIAYNQYGPSDPSSSSEYFCNTDLCKPAGHPTNVRAVSVAGPHLVIEWQSLARIKWGSPDLWYEVFWRLKHSLHNFNGPIRIDNGNNKFNLSPTPFYMEYEFAVAARNPLSKNYNETVVERNNIHNQYPTLRIYSNFSGESVPQICPQNFQLKSFINGVKALVTWESVRANLSMVFGELKGYVIKYSEISCHIADCVKNEYADSNDESIILHNLPAWADVKMQIAVRNNHYTGPWSKSIKFKTPEGYPGPVLNLRAMPFRRNGIKVTWVKTNEPRGNLLGYAVKFSLNMGVHLTENEFHPDHTINDPSITTFTRGGFEVNLLYRVEVRAITSRGFSTKPAISFITLGASVVPSKPIIQAAILNEYNVNISWDPKLMITPAAIFYVKYRYKGDETSYHRTEDEIFSDFIVISFLDPHTEYEFILVATDGVYNGTESDPVYIKIAGRSKFYDYTDFL